MKRSALAATMLCLALAATGLGAQAPPPDFLRAERGFAELGALPDPLNVPSLERAALLASGLTPESSVPYESKLRALFEALGAYAGTIADPAAKGEAVLGFLHERVLRAYSENATSLNGILDAGIYNCVSSAVLYMLAARDLGLDVDGVRTSDHAFCTLLAGNRRIDVETTNPYGFDPGNKKEFKDSFGSATGYAYVAPGGYGDRKAVRDRALVGLILSNRASMLERVGRFAEATKLGADSDELCRDADSKAFLLDRINNFVVDFESRRDFVGAETAARAAAAALPGESRIAALSFTASYNRAAALAQAGDWVGAFDRATALGTELEGAAAAGTELDAAVARDARALGELEASSLAGLARSYARAGDFTLARQAVAERAGRAGTEATKAAYAAVGEVELVRAVNERPFAEAAAIADRILVAGEVTTARYAQAMSAIYGNEAGRIGSAGDWLGGAALAEAGIAKLAAAKAESDGDLARLAQLLRHNFVVEAHNRFAALYNAGKYAEAQAIMEKAFASLPGDPSLARDLAAAKDARK
jgi:hypothetical protein